MRYSDFGLRISNCELESFPGTSVVMPASSKNGDTSTVDTQEWTDETSVRYMLSLGADDMNPAVVVKE